jgi:hypothetical protein
MSEQHPGKSALKLMRGYQAVLDFGHRGKADSADIASYVSDLERRLEKAEAERDAAYNEALEKAAEVAR